MTVALAVLCALLGVPGGMLANLLVERVPEKLPLRPLPRPGSLARSPRQALVIAVTVALFTATAVRFRSDWVVPAYLVFFVCLVSVSVIDFQIQIIPSRILYPTIFASVPLLALAAAAGNRWDRFGHALMGATLAWLVLLVLHFAWPAGMGFGDVRLAFVLGLFLGWIGLSHVLTGLFLGDLLICAAFLVLALLGRRGLRDHMAFGPFLAAGSALAVFAGPAILRWWLG